MAVLEFWGCTLIAFGPAIMMFSMTVAKDPVKVIILISSSFFWLLSFLLVAILWYMISSFFNYLIIGAYLAVISQEVFRYLFHKVAKRGQVFLKDIMGNDTDQGPSNQQSSRANEIHQSNSSTSLFVDRIPISYVSGLGFGLINAAFSLMNVLTDYLGPGSVGLKGDSIHFLLVSSVTALAFILLNVAWSVIMSEGIEKSDMRFVASVVITHLIATTITFANRMHLQVLSISSIYILTIGCGFMAAKIAGLDFKRLTSVMNT